MTIEKTTRRQLQPFGGIAAKADFERRREEALRTLSRQECFDLGYLTVKDLDDEELRHGRCRDDRGKIPTRNGHTELIPSEQYDAMVREHELRYKQKLRQNLDKAIDVMVDIMEDDTCEPKDRMEAAKYIFERTAGKTPDQVNVNVKSAPWEDLLGQITGIASVSRAEHRELGTGIIEADWEEVDDQEGDGQDSAELLSTEADDSQSPIRQTATSRPADVEPTEVDDVSGAAKAAYRLMAPGPAEHTVPQQGVQKDGQSATIPDMAPVHQRRPATQGPIHDTRQTGGQNSGQDLPHVPLRGATGEDLAPPPRYVANNDKPVYYTEGDIPGRPDPYQGHRKAQAQSYADQARQAQDVARRRKEASQRRQDAKKRRKIARAMGADQIKSEITGAEVDDDGTVNFGITD